MVTAIVFDLSEVYLRGLYGTHRFLSQKLGVPVSSEDLCNEISRELFLGNITEEEYWKLILEKNKWKINVDELKNAVRGNFQEIEGTRAIILKLKTNGYKLGLLSVHAREWVDYLEDKFDFHKLFHSVLYSFEVSALKPDRKTFELMLGKLMVKPIECVFVDDGPNNVAVATELGMKAILFESPEKLLISLKGLGVRVS